MAQQKLVFLAFSASAGEAAEPRSVSRIPAPSWCRPAPGPDYEDDMAVMRRIRATQAPLMKELAQR
jgi:hypothetical protein